MSKSFFFYDLETSGVSPRSARIMQFAGQRTDLDLNPIGESINHLIKITDDILPEPDAILITGITPQKTLAEGISEAEFFKKFISEIATPDTVFVGFNSIRFDDEFIRYGLYRNFYDAYEWQWKDGRAKWDILDLVRMTRALRPEGIKWPFASDGKPANRLQLLTSVNGLDHFDAHDALSDVLATIDVAKLIKQKQPKLFDFSFLNSDKKSVQRIVDTDQPFVYISGAYDSEYEKMTIAYSLGKHPNKGASLVYDLRHDPTQYFEMNTKELIDNWKYKKDSDEPRLPIKTLQFNRCPAVAPINVLSDDDKKRLSIDDKKISENLQLLRSNSDFYEKIIHALEIIEKDRLQTALMANQNTVDSELYSGFFGDDDKRLLSKVVSSKPEELNDYIDKFRDQRLKSLLPLYKARNFPTSLTQEEREEWESFRVARLQVSLPKFMERLAALSATPDITSEQQYLLQELHLYAESILPVDL